MITEGDTWRVGELTLHDYWVCGVHRAVIRLPSGAAYDPPPGFSPVPAPESLLPQSSAWSGLYRDLPEGLLGVDQPVTVDGSSET